MVHFICFDHESLWHLNRSPATSYEQVNHYIQVNYYEQLNHYVQVSHFYTKLRDSFFDVESVPKVVLLLVITKALSYNQFELLYILAHG